MAACACNPSGMGGRDSPASLAYTMKFQTNENPSSNEMCKVPKDQHLKFSCDLHMHVHTCSTYMCINTFTHTHKYIPVHKQRLTLEEEAVLSTLWFRC